MRAEGGFTLLEILVALAIVVTGIAAAVQAAGVIVDQTGNLESRMLSSWVASNRLAELRLSRSWPGPGGYQGAAVQGGRDWYYTEQVTETSDPDLRRVDLLVYEDAARRRESASLFGYLRRP